MNVRFGPIKSGVVIAASGDTLGTAAKQVWRWNCLSVLSSGVALLHPRSWGLWLRALPVSSVKENQLCLFAFLGDQAPREAILAIKLCRRSGIRISGGAVDAANSHSSKTLSPRGYQ